MNEPLGIVEELAARRAKYARFAYVAPHDRLPRDPKAERPKVVRRPAPVAAPLALEKPTIAQVQAVFLAAFYDAGGRADGDAPYTMNHLCGQRRHAVLSHPRQVAIALARHITRKSLPEIGRLFGDKDHTTVMLACSRALDHIAASPILAATHAAVLARFEVKK